MHREDLKVSESAESESLALPQHRSHLPIDWLYTQEKYRLATMVANHLRCRRLFD